ncbi:hypothetical protein [Halobacillus faecis]
MLNVGIDVYEVVEGSGKILLGLKIETFVGFKVVGEGGLLKGAVSIYRCFFNKSRYKITRGKRLEDGIFQEGRSKPPSYVSF